MIIPQPYQYALVERLSAEIRRQYRYCTLGFNQASREGAAFWLTYRSELFEISRRRFEYHALFLNELAEIFEL